MLWGDFADSWTNGRCVSRTELNCSCMQLDFSLRMVCLFFTAYVPELIPVVCSNKKIVATETQKNTVYQLAKVLVSAVSHFRPVLTIVAQFSLFCLRQSLRVLLMKRGGRWKKEGEMRKEHLVRTKQRLHPICPLGGGEASCIAMQVCSGTERWWLSSNTIWSRSRTSASSSPSTSSTSLSPSCLLPLFSLSPLPSSPPLSSLRSPLVTHHSSCFARSFNYSASISPKQSGIFPLAWHAV